MRKLLLLLLLMPLTIFAIPANCHMMPPIKKYVGPKVSQFANYHGYSNNSYNSWIRRSQYVTMKDGVTLATDILIPAINCKIAKKPLPVLLMQTPYQRAYVAPAGNVLTQIWHHHFQTFIRHGYVFVTVAIRGTAASFGVYQAILNPLEKQDAHQIISWLAQQPFSNGNIGMIGDSYQGLVAYMAASTHPTHLKAIYAETTPFNLYRFLYPGGMLRNGLITYWSQLTHNINLLNQLVPVDQDPKGFQLMQARREHRQNADIYQQIIQAPFFDSQTPYFSWENNNAAMHLAQINSSHIPIYISDSWYDVFTPDALFWYANLTVPKKLLMGSWPHNTFIAPQAVIQNRIHINNTEALRWFDYWLKGIANGVMQQPNIHYNVIKKDYVSGEWQHSSSWPIKQIKHYQLFVNSHNKLSFVKNQHPSSDVYYVNNTTSTGHASRWNNANGQGFINYSGLNANDAKSLLYTSFPLNNNLQLLGFPILTLYLSANVSNLDVHALLEEVDPQGVSHYLTEGMLRVAQRNISKAPWNYLGLPYHSFLKSDMQPLKANQIAKVTFFLYPLSRLVKKGDRIRLVLMNADMGNTQTLPYPKGTIMKVYFGPNTYQSSLTLPIKAH